MNATAWIALASLAFLVVSSMFGMAWYVGRLFGELPGMIRATTRKAIRNHKRGCSNFDPNTGMRSMPTAPNIPIYPPRQRQG